MVFSILGRPVTWYTASQFGDDSFLMVRFRFCMVTILVTRAVIPNRRFPSQICFKQLQVSRTWGTERLCAGFPLPCLRHSPISHIHSYLLLESRCSLAEWTGHCCGGSDFPPCELKFTQQVHSPAFSPASLQLFPEHSSGLNKVLLTIYL